MFVLRDLHLQLQAVKQPKTASLDNIFLLIDASLVNQVLCAINGQIRSTQLKIKLKVVRNVLQDTFAQAEAPLKQLKNAQLVLLDLNQELSPPPNVYHAEMEAPTTLLVPLSALFAVAVQLTMQTTHYVNAMVLSELGS